MELCLAVVAGSGCFAFTSSSLPLSICAQETAELATGKNTLCLAQPYFLALRPSRNRRKPAADKVDALRLITLARDPIIFSTRPPYVLSTSSHAAWTFLWKTPDAERRGRKEGLFHRFTGLRLVSFIVYLPDKVVNYCNLDPVKRGRIRVVDEGMNGKSSKFFSFFFFEILRKFEE